MSSYKVKYHKNSVLLIAMAGIPVFFISLMFYFLFNIPTPSSELVILLLTALLVATIFSLLIWIKNTQIFVAAKVSLENEGITIKLKRTSFLYRRTMVFSSWKNIDRITEMFDNHNGGVFYQIAFKSPNYVINLGALKHADAEAIQFFRELQYYQAQAMPNQTFGQSAKPEFSLEI
ncbi:hypothetical protein [Pedobacter sp. BMA]|uniref:hypothetical protein n=1 Tax=Pedobacter sp. BMA TaxID=1663685 RepID=UPI0006498A66|nr:hypothetical protein [Pedobacter sp. BMA]KLT64527.1 hypothetical protein AB669_12210 [Pedobacter sp. BMA]